MKRIAVPTVGGMLTSTVLTLVVIPAVYSLWRQRGLAVTRGAAIILTPPAKPVFAQPVLT